MQVSLTRSYCRGVSALGWIVLLSSAQGAVLRWEQTEITLQAAPMAESVEAMFTFTNTASEPVTLAGVHSSCGCTVPELKKNTYAPGESGTIRAVFTVGERTGHQEKTITVATAAPDSTTTVLTLRVDIPKLFEVTPYFVIWNNGEPPAPKSIDLRILAPDLLSVQSIESRHASFTAAITPAADSPAHFKVTVTPTSTSEVTNGAILVVLATPKGQTRTLSLYALVRGGPQPAVAPKLLPAPASTTEPVRAETTH